MTQVASTGAFTFADYGEAEIDNELRKGDCKKNNIYLFAINANWKFLSEVPEQV